MSNLIKNLLGLLLMFLNQLMTFAVDRHCLHADLDLTDVIIFSRIFFDIIPICDLAGFTNLASTLVGNEALWSFIVTLGSWCEKTSILSSRSSYIYTQLMLLNGSPTLIINRRKSLSNMI